MAVLIISNTTAIIITAYMNGTASLHISFMYCRNIHILGSRPHAGLFRQVLVPVRSHLPKIRYLQHHPQGYLSQLVLVVEYELYQLDRKSVV